MKQTSFILYTDFEEVFSKLSDEDAALLIRTIFSYQRTGEVPTLPPTMDLIFIPIRQQLDRNKEKYLQKCQKMSENISSRWKKREGSPEPQTTEEAKEERKEGVESTQEFQEFLNYVQQETERDVQDDEKRSFQALYHSLRAKEKYPQETMFRYVKSVAWQLKSKGYLRLEEFTNESLLKNLKKGLKDKKTFEVQLDWLLKEENKRKEAEKQVGYKITWL